MVLSENFGNKAIELLPKSIIDLGTILKKDNALSIIKITSNSAKVNTVLDNTQSGQTMSYTFNNVRPGEIITLEIDPKLADKIGLNDNVIEIFYNKAKV